MLGILQVPVYTRWTTGQPLMEKLGPVQEHIHRTKRQKQVQILVMKHWTPYFNIELDKTGQNAAFGQMRV